jgi:membrane associated rhomboid family serine protease
MWLVEILDTVALDNRLESSGIRPRSVDGLDGILWAPFLHGGFAHLISNTIPFVLLSALVLAKGLRRYVTASAIIILLGGLLVWLFAIGSNEIHVGASGWVFGLFGYLIATAWYERRPLSILLAVVAVVLYGSTILFGFLPRPGLSWEGHLFGFIAGIAAARLLTPRKKPISGELGGPVEMSG